MEDRHRHCPNCSAPLDVPLGETEVLCEYCETKLRFEPGEGELAVVRTREEMKYRERVAVRQVVLRHELEREKAEAWRRTAAQVAIAAAPFVGAALARGAFRAALGRPAGCLGCSVTLAAVVLGFAALLLAL